MGLRRGGAVQNDAAAAKDSMNGVDLDQQDDVVENEATTTGTVQGAAPAVNSVAKPAEPPAPVAEATTAEVDETARQEEAATQVAAVSEAPATDVAVRSESQPAAAMSANVQQKLADSGFDGLNFGFGSFPVITLQNAGYFESSEGGNLGTEFFCSLGASVPKWIVKNNMQGKEEDFAYTYDGITAVNGELIEEITKAWEAKGWKWEKKPYLDVQATLLSDDPEDNGTLILLSVPKTSIPRFSGYVATLMARGKHPSQVMTRVYMGDKVTKVQYPFFPWAFKRERDLDG